MNRIFTQLIFGTTLSLVLVSCMTVAPVNQQYERAATLGKGNFEAAGSISRYESDNVMLNKNYGFRGGYGVSDEFDLKVRYERRIPADTSLNFHTNYASVVPKFSLLKNNVAVLLPISRYEDVYNLEGKKFKDISWSVSPQLIRTYTNTKNSFDFSIMGKIDYLVHNRSDNEVFLGFNMGTGISTDLDKWSVRPEIGLQLSPLIGDYAWSYGIGIQLAIPGFKRK